MNESIYNNAGMPSGQGAAPEVPDDLRGTYQAMQMRSEQSVIHVRPRVITEFIERIAALTLERDTLKAENEEGKARFYRIGFEDCRMQALYVTDESEGFSERIGALEPTLTAIESARASTPPTLLVFTCPFDGEVWRFHTQEQLDMLRKHLEWHATNINSKEYSV